MNYGYIRVSTRDQNEERQRLAMGELEIPEKNLYRDHQSGKDFDRPQYRTSRALTGWAGTIGRSWSSGGC